MSTYRIHASKIVGYTFDAEILCPTCVLSALPTGPGQAFDGWADLSDQPVEQSLSELAIAFGIDRTDESTFDSSEFPKVIFASSVDGDEPCDGCGTDLLDP